MSECQYSIIEFNKIISGDIMDYLDRLIAERIDRDLSQKTVGEIINKSQQGYDHIEKRRAKLTIEDFMKLCEFYNVSPEYYLGYKEKRKALK